MLPLGGSDNSIDGFLIFREGNAPCEPGVLELPIPPVIFLYSHAKHIQFTFPNQ